MSCVSRLGSDGSGVSSGHHVYVSVAHEQHESRRAVHGTKHEELNGLRYETAERTNFGAETEKNVGM